MTITRARARERLLANLGLSYAALAVRCVRDYRATGRRRYAVAGALGALATVAGWGFGVAAVLALLGAYAGHNVRGLVELAAVTAAALLVSSLGADLLTAQLVDEPEPAGEAR